MDIMKLMPITTRQDLVADVFFPTDSHCKIIGYPIAWDIDLRVLGRIIDYLVQVSSSTFRALLGHYEYLFCMDNNI